MKKVLSIIITLLFITNINILSQNRGGMFHKFGSSVLTANHITESQYCPEFQAVYNAFNTKPHADTAAFMNAMVYSLDTAGLLDKMDLLYILANNNSYNANINWINPSTFTLTDPDTTNPQFFRYQGYRGNGSSMYLSTNYTPYNHETKVSTNSVTLGAWMVDWPTTSGVAVGANDPYSVRTEIQAYSKATYPRGFANSAGNATNPSTAIGAEAGLHIITRRSSSDNEYYCNNVSIATSTAASSTNSCQNEVFILAKSSYTGTGSSTPFNGRLGIVFYMAGITDNEASILFTIFDTYMTAIGL